MKQRATKQQVNFRLSSALLQRIQKEACSTHRTKTMVVERALHRFFEKTQGERWDQAA